MMDNNGIGNYSGGTSLKKKEDCRQLHEDDVQTTQQSHSSRERGLMMMAMSKEEGWVVVRGSTRRPSVFLID